MSREWKPGDVAMVTFEGDPAPVLAFRDGDEHCIGWSLAEHRGSSIWISAEHVVDARPLVVIDPESADDAERLVRLFWANGTDDCDDMAAMRAALREFANPKPPKPDEPMGLGAVVVDDDGSVLVRVTRDGDRPWRAEGGHRFSWDEIDVLTELAPGAEMLADWEIDLLRGAR